MKILLASLLLAVSAFSQVPVNDSLFLPEDLAIVADSGLSGIILTNNAGGVYGSETKGPNRFAWEGFYAEGKEMMKDYALRTDGRPFERENALRVLVSPDRYRRIYPGGAEETVYLLDSLDALVVDVTNVGGNSINFYPLFSGPQADSAYYSGFAFNVLVIAPTQRMVRTPQEDYPAVVALSLLDELYLASGFYESHLFGPYFSPSFLSTVKKDSLHRLMIVPGDSLQDAFTKLKTSARSLERMVEIRHRRYAGLLDRLLPSLPDAEARRAFSWGIIGTAAMLSNSGEPADADSLFPVPCSGLLLGGREQSRAYLHALTLSQESNPSLQTFGEIPTKPFPPEGVSLDLAPWFTLLADRYVRMSADSGALQELYLTARQAIQARLKSQVDSNGAIDSALAAGWRSVLSGIGALEEHNNAAGSAQRLWLRQLAAGIRLARRAGDAASAEAWELVLKKNSPHRK